MSLSERSRSHLYAGLCSVVDDEEAVQEMLSHFPARDVDEPVTRDHLRAGLAELRADIAAVDGRVTIGLATLDQRITEGLSALEQRAVERFAAVDLRMAEGFAAAERRSTAQLEAFRKDLTTAVRNWTLGGLGLVVAAAGTVTAVVQAVAS